MHRVMAPIKFEEHIKERLEKREIKPSADSWERLNKKLDNKSGKNDRKTWIFLVAAVLVVALMTTIFVQNSAPAGERTKITNSDADTENVISRPQEIEKTQLASEKTDDQNFENAEKSVGKKNTEFRREPLKTVVSEGLENLASVESIPLKTEIFKAETKVEGNVKTSDQEIETLLAEAFQDIEKKEISDDEKRLMAEQLLSEVEDDLDKSFRKEVFDMLKEGFGKARVAIVNRNQ